MLNRCVLSQTRTFYSAESVVEQLLDTGGSSTMNDALHDSLDARHKGGWENVKSSCMLCEMDKRTEWHLETPSFVIAEKLGGGPFVVSKTHQKSLSDEEWDHMEHVVGVCFDEFELDVLMHHCENHWHGHLKNYTQSESFK